MYCTNLRVTSAVKMCVCNITSKSKRTSPLSILWDTYDYCFTFSKKKANCPSSKFWDDLYYLHIKKAGGGGKEGHIIFQFGFVLLISECNYVFDSFLFLKNCSSISMMFLFSNKGFNLPDI